MKKILMIAAAILVMSQASAQTVRNAKDMLTLTPIIAKGTKLPQDAEASLNMKMKQIVTQNGFGSVAGQFALVPNVVTIEKEATATAPVKIVVKLEVSFYVVDILEGTMISEQSFIVSGIDTHDNKAYIRAINQLNPRGTSMKTFMSQTRTKILDYYATQLPVMIAKADALMQQGKYEEAYALLSSVPYSVEGYDMVLERQTEIYKKLVDTTSAAAVSRAKAYAAAGEIDMALAAIEGISPNSFAADEIPAIIEEIRQKTDVNTLRKHEQQLKEAETKAKASEARTAYSNYAAERVNAWYAARFK